jgi:MraZ protein
LFFNGTFEHTLDAKNRLTLPARFRKQLAGRVFLVRGEEPCIAVFPAEEYERLAVEALKDTNPLSPEGRDARRRIFNYADEIDVDTAGRVTLQGRHLTHAGIDGRDVVITGSGESLELWAPAAWQAKDAQLMGL